MAVRNSRSTKGCIRKKLKSELIYVFFCKKKIYSHNNANTMNLIVAIVSINSKIWRRFNCNLSEKMYMWVKL